MHQVSEMSAFSIKEITKIEGSAGLEVLLEDGKVTSVQFAINEYKRFQFAPVLRVSSKAFGRGRRMPLVARYLS